MSSSIAQKSLSSATEGPGQEVLPLQYISFCEKKDLVALAFFTYGSSLNYSACSIQVGWTDLTRLPFFLFLSPNLFVPWRWLWGLLCF